MYGWRISVIFTVCAAFGIQSSDICLLLTYVCVLDLHETFKFYNYKPRRHCSDSTSNTIKQLDPQPCFFLSHMDVFN